MQRFGLRERNIILLVTLTTRFKADIPIFLSHPCVTRLPSERPETFVIFRENVGIN